MKKILRIGLRLSLAVILTCAAKASITFTPFTWDPNPANYNSSTLALEPSSGTMIVEDNSGVFSVSSMSWIHDHIPVADTADTYTGSVEILGDGDALLYNGTSFPSIAPTITSYQATWGATTAGSSWEDVAVGNGANDFYGDWVNLSGIPLAPSAVPEPTTIISAALLLLPFGIGALRILRKNSAA